jgi:predicted nuclease with TOPRIM domain
MMVPPKNIEPPKSSVDEVISKKPDVIMKPPSDLMVEKKEGELSKARERLSHMEREFATLRENHRVLKSEFDDKLLQRDSNMDQQIHKLRD